MKHLKLFFALFAMLALGVGNAWAETIVLKASDGFPSSYQSSEKTFTKSEITFGCLRTMYNGNGSPSGWYKQQVMQLSKNESSTVGGDIWNVTSINNIAKITVKLAVNNNDFTLFYGTSAKPSTNSIAKSSASSSTETITYSGYSNKTEQPGQTATINVFTFDLSGKGATHFLIDNGSRANYIWEIVIETSSATPDAIAISLDKTTLNLQEGATETLTATVTGSTSPVTWSSSKTAVASVDNTGKVTAVAAGEATITAAIGDVKATCDVTVTAAPTPDPEEPGTSGETVTYILKDDPNHPENGVEWFSGTIDQYTGWTATKGTNDTPKYYNTGTGLRVYNGGKFTITSTKVMTSITLTFSSGSYTFSADNTTNPQTVSPNANSYEWSVERTCRLQKIEITYAADAGGDEGGTEEPVLSVSPENITWKGIAASAEKSEEINVTLLNIEDVMAELSGDNPTAFSIDKDLLEASGKIIVSKNTTIIGDYAAILTITDTDTQTKTIALSMEVVADPEPTGTFEKFTGTIEEGDYVLVANGTTDALKNTITSNNRFDCGTVEIAEDKIVNPDKSVIWHIAANGTYWTMYNESTTKYAGGTSTKNQGALLDDVTDLAKWTIKVADQGVYTFENYGRSQQTSDSGNKFLSKNNQNAYWATYASGQTNPVLYKKSDGKQPAGLVYETNKYRTKLGDSFATPTLTNPNSLKVTYSSSNNDVAEVASDGSVTIKAVGGVEITATFAGSETHRQGSAKYTICVTEHAGTETDPYSVADARRVIDVMETAEGVYATGIVSEIVTAYNSEYGNITYNISIDGSTAADQLQAYRGKGVNGENFSSANDIKVGDEVVIKGNLKLHNGTLYEFDANNQLVSLKREKQQAGLAYATTEYSTTLGESFETPTLTNPNGLTVTYSSDNTSAVEVNEETGEVTIKAVGKAKITATFAGNLTYAPGSASYTITVTGVATLPFAFDGKQADIENTPGMSHDGIDATDYKESPYLKMNTTGDWLVIRFDSEPEKLSYDIENNSFNGGTFSVLESADGETYTDVAVYTTIEETQNEEYTLLSTSRYVKFIYTEKLDGNVGLGNIKITKPDLRQEAGIAWSAESTTITIGDAFTAPTLSNPKGLTLSCTSDNEDLATVTNAGVVTLKEGVTGKAVITATFAGNETYKPAEVTTTIIVNPKTGDVVILAKHQGQWYAMKADYVSGKTDRLAAISVYYVNGKLYNVSEEDKAAITWTRSAYGDNTVSFQNNGKYLKGKSSTTLILEEDEDGLYKWNAADNTMLIGETTRTFLYHKDGMFRNYSITWAGETSPSYSNLPVVTAPEFATGNVYTINTSATNGTTKGAGTYVEGSTVTLIADPAMDYTFVNWTVDGEVVSTANPYEFEAKKNLDLVANFATIEQTEKKLTGTFSVGQYEVAQFATGNLQYKKEGENETWRFAKQQYQYVGEANINVGDPAFEGWIDMFGWSNGEDNDFGANPSSNKNDYDGEFVDWGTLFPVEDNWATLTKDQWDYLLNKRGAGKKQIARVGTVFGVLLFPDEWTMPSGISVTAQYDSYFKVNVYNYTLTQWTELENAGALFMPAAGRRFGGHGNTYRADGITNIGEEYKLQYCTNDLAAYWTSTKNDDGTKVNYLLNLGDKGAKYSTLELGWVEYGHAGHSVRLAKVTDVYTRKVTNGEWGTICLPKASSSVTGATFYEVSSLVYGEGLWLDQLADGAQLVAGKPYIFQATATKITVTYTGAAVANPVEGANGLTGTFTNIADGGLTGNYIIAENKVWVAGANTSLPANRAYIANTVPTTPQAQIPGRRRVCMGENQTTGLDNITNGENTTIKVIENGQLIIIRNGEKFNAQGQRL